MLSQKSILKVVQSEREYVLSCNPDSPLADVKSSLLEMLGYVQSIIDNAEKKAAEVSKVEEEVLDTEQTL
jgi:hypothetical protein